MLAAGVLLAMRLLAEGESRPVAWRDLTAQVGPLTITDTRAPPVPGRGGARPLPGPSAALEAPRRRSTSRDTQLLLVSPGPRSSTGYEVEVLSVREQDGEITVRVRERTPTLEDRVEARVTHPYRLLSLPAGTDVAVDWLGR